MTNKKVLEVKNLVIKLPTNEGCINVVDGVSFSLYRGRTLGMVGESGAGKSLTALSIARLIDNSYKSNITTEGEILFHDVDLLKQTCLEMRKIRGNQISMIFQEPSTSLNPLMTIGNQILEVLENHCPELSGEEKFKKSIEMLDLVGIPNPEKRFSYYPHQISGGMKQRVMIAMALICEPEVLIADEPTTALDVTVQAQILDLLKSLQKKINMSILLISHDLGVIADMCHNIVVMHSGKIVEEGDMENLLTAPKHPYTKGFIA